MRALIQRVSEGTVDIAEHNYTAEISKGMVILLGIRNNDTEEEVNFVADKCCNLRIFGDENDKMNLSLKDINGEVLIISQFTLYGDARKGNRPGFTDAAGPELAEKLYNKFIDRTELNLGKKKVKRGIFGAMMNVKIFNDGPVTILVESK
ncbi:MAG: D-tyrosyl-tRNA(Tyr) deacylase [Ignavibacteria bacterium RBG_13_36_8]|nr:MAG: D-tyrosyl-tRNA(Tyr) deacylase [Ignavibacteria bacterium RBG_13_36_8]